MAPMNSLAAEKLRSCLNDIYIMSGILNTLVRKPDRVNHMEQLQVVKLCIESIRQNSETITRLVTNEYPELQ